MLIDAASARLRNQAIDSLPEWSKGVDSSSTRAICVGSNPTAVTHPQSRTRGLRRPKLLLVNARVACWVRRFRPKEEIVGSNPISSAGAQAGFSWLAAVAPTWPHAGLDRGP